MPRSATRPPVEGLPARVNFVHMLRGSWRLYRQSFSVLVGPFVALVALGFVAIYAAGLLVGDLDSIVVQVAALFLVTLAFVFCGSLLVGSAALVTVERAAGEPATFATARAALRPLRPARLRAALAATLLAVPIIYGLGWVGAFMLAPLLLGPPIVAHVMAFERMPLRDAWARSKELARGHWARILLYLLGLSLLLFYVEAILLAAVNVALIGLLPELALDLVVYGLQVVVTGVLLPLPIAAVLVVYLDLRAREQEEELTWDDVRPDDASTADVEAVATEPV